MIPIIDVGPLQSGNEDDIAALAERLFSVYSTLGFGVLINHPIPQALTDQLFDVMHAFHSLPLREKMQLTRARSLRGFIPLNSSTMRTSKLARVTKPNQNSAFMIINELTLTEQERFGQTPFAGRQVWPEQLPAFKQVSLAYYAKMEVFAAQLMRVFALMLGQGFGGLASYFTHPNIFMRMSRYPPSIENGDQDLMGYAPHTDNGCLTLLLQDEVGGLQVQHPGGPWLDVPYQRGALILNIGDLMECWSNGLLKATPHRVINKSTTKFRYAAPFFYNCNFESVVAPLSSCVSEEHPVRYKPIAFGETLRESILENYSVLERL